MKMTLKEFVDLLKTTDECFFRTREETFRTRLVHIKKQEIDENCVVYKGWRTGGIGGGSCWGDGGHFALDGDVEPEFTALDNILSKICPNITFLQYKQIMCATQSFDETEYEYYGNSTKYKYVYISMKDLYDQLVTLRILNG